MENFNPELYENVLLQVNYSLLILAKEKNLPAELAEIIKDDNAKRFYNLCRIKMALGRN